MSPSTIHRGIAYGDIVKGCEVVTKDGRCGVFEKVYGRGPWLLVLYEDQELLSFVHPRSCLRVGWCKDLSVHHPGRRVIKRKEKKA